MIAFTQVRLGYIFATLLCIGTVLASTPNENCMECICSRNDCERRENRTCTDGVCGPFYISEEYYNDCGRPGPGWQQCTKFLECSRLCVKNYMAKYADDCTYPLRPTCKDFARIHWGNEPTGCRVQSLARVEDAIRISWGFVDRCCAELGNCDN